MDSCSAFILILNRIIAVFLCAGRYLANTGVKALLLRCETLTVDL